MFVIVRLRGPRGDAERLLRVGSKLLGSVTLALVVR